MALTSVLWGGVAVCLFALIYTYAGYPALLWVLTRSRSPPDHGTFDEWPSVTMIVAAHNEESVIGEKLNDVAEIRYPGSFECIVVSDSTDATDDVVRERGSECITLLSLSERRGKSRALNEAVTATDSDVIVFSDANTMYDRDAVRELVAPLADPAVGCTTGHLHLYDESGETTESAYWRYELALRCLEARLGTTVGVNGGVLALRREAFEPLPVGALTDDFVVALQQLAAGRRVVYVPDATAAERTAGGLWAEFDRRVRIGTGNYQTLAWFPELLSPTRGVVSFEYLSHKVLRWLVPGVLTLLAVLTVALAALTETPVALALLGAEVLCVGLAFIGAVSGRARRTAICRLPAYVFVMHLAFVMGFVQFLAGPTVDIWKSTRS